jgi:ribonuclease HII
MTRRIDPGLIPSHPNLEFENSLWQEGLSLVAGLDEAGRGSLAGPVTAAAVILPSTGGVLRKLAGVQDSKRLSVREREEQQILVESTSLLWGVGFVSPAEIDQMGIAFTTRLAMQRALEKLELAPQHLLIDYLVLPDNPIPQTRLVKGDARSLSIAAASILAKTHRDAWMISAAEKFPVYHFKTNKGYGTAAHREAILQHGPCPLHRMSFAPLREMI